MVKDGAVQLDDIAGKITMLEIACRRCERRGRLLVSRLIEQHGAGMRLPELRYIVASDCPRVITDKVCDRGSVPGGTGVDNKRRLTTLLADRSAPLPALVPASSSLVALAAMPRR
jgi:hypothetical protein